MNPFRVGSDIDWVADLDTRLSRDESLRLRQLGRNRDRDSREQGKTTIISA
jgi:hypothetical protein